MIFKFPDFSLADFLFSLIQLTLSFPGTAITVVKKSLSCLTYGGKESDQPYQKENFNARETNKFHMLIMFIYTGMSLESNEIRD